jgi:hypothetical protein
MSHATFEDTLDRLGSVSARLAALAETHQPVRAEPSFARALLEAPHANLIREAESWEAALFARVRAPAAPAPTTAPVSFGVGPAGIPLATPLKPVRRARAAEASLEPEDYARAGLRLLDR